MKIMSINIRGFSLDRLGGCKISWFRKLRKSESPDIVLIQETKRNQVDDKWVERLWGSRDFNFVQKPKVGKSGGMLIIWDPNAFKVEEAVEKPHLLAIKGRWTGKVRDTIVANIYGPHRDDEKKKLWDTLENFMDVPDVDWVLGGDFNEVRNREERQNSQFIERRAALFNKFIENCNLVEVPLLGRRFTRICDNGIKFSKLDHFLVSDQFLSSWGDVSAVALDRNSSDHCPIILRDKNFDFGPKPFKFFDAWLELKDIEKIVVDAWNKNVTSRRADCQFRDKLKNVKTALRTWSYNTYNSLDSEIEKLKKTVMDLESKADAGVLNDSDRESWLNARVSWLKKKKDKADMLKQKV
ncbi:uncharacterized protein [Rutidosis leptorrhynchoides]|uniref:uncharacterized protein n=1 Tax=Rutidosis leptorrhynchoides TaxID=125765 RepID=UPI003A9A57D5